MNKESMPLHNVNSGSGEREEPVVTEFPPRKIEPRVIKRVSNIDPIEMKPRIEPRKMESRIEPRKMESRISPVEIKPREIKSRSRKFIDPSKKD